MSVNVNLQTKLSYKNREPSEVSFTPDISKSEVGQHVTRYLHLPCHLTLELSFPWLKHSTSQANALRANSSQRACRLC